MTNDSLIGKIEALKYPSLESDICANKEEKYAHNRALDSVLIYARQHTAAPDVVTSCVCEKHGCYVTRSVCAASLKAMEGVEANSGNSASHSSAPGPKGDNLAPSALSSEISVVKEQKGDNIPLGCVSMSVRMTPEPLVASRHTTASSPPISESSPSPKPVSIAQCARAAFEKKIALINVDHPRLGIRSAQWDELSEEMKQQEITIIRAAFDLAGVAYE